MKRSTKLSGFTVLIALIFTLVSCEKDNEVVSVKDKLTSKTWQVEEVINYNDGEETIQYKRGAENNEEDYSMIRYTYNTNGTITYVDSFENTGNDGTWKLLENDTKLQIGWGFLSVVFEDVVVTDNGFSYKIKWDEHAYSIWKFSPVGK